MVVSRGRLVLFLCKPPPHYRFLNFYVCLINKLQPRERSCRVARGLGTSAAACEFNASVTVLCFCLLVFTHCPASCFIRSTNAPWKFLHVDATALVHFFLPLLKLGKIHRKLYHLNHLEEDSSGALSTFILLCHCCHSICL